MPDEMDKVTEVDILRVLKRSAKNKVSDDLVSYRRNQVVFL